MLRVNQRLDKLSAMHGDFTARGMLLRGYASKQNISLFLKPSAVGLGGEGEEDEEDGPVEGDDVLAHVVLAQARGMWVYFSTGILFLFREVRNYPRDIETLATFIGEPELHNMALECIATQMHTSTKDLPCITSKISVFSSAVATFYAPSDPSGKNGMRRERIRSMPSWRGRERRHDCTLVVMDDSQPGMMGMNVVRVLLFFSFDYNGVEYPCAVVEWFQTVGLDDVMGLWVVRPDFTEGKRDKSVLHLDSFLRGAHLIPRYGTQKLPLDFHFSYSLDAFRTYYVNKYIDHHANEIIF